MPWNDHDFTLSRKFLTKSKKIWEEFFLARDFCRSDFFTKIFIVRILPSRAPIGSVRFLGKTATGFNPGLIFLNRSGRFRHQTGSNENPNRRFPDIHRLKNILCIKKNSCLVIFFAFKNIFPK
jgi:hypothetical protein